jgi:hypothetical protein
MHDNNDIQEIEGKRFPHKRAFLLENIMVEFVLVKKDADGYITHFFEKYRYKWPTNTFDGSIIKNGTKINIASKEALKMYRKDYNLIEEVRNESLKN